jgi:hypothetical protein
VYYLKKEKEEMLTLILPKKPNKQLFACYLALVKIDYLKHRGIPTFTDQIAFLRYPKQEKVRKATAEGLYTHTHTRPTLFFRVVLGSQPLPNM